MNIAERCFLTMFLVMSDIWKMYCCPIFISQSIVSVFKFEYGLVSIPTRSWREVLN